MQKFSHFKDESVATIKEPESIQLLCTMALNLNFSGLLNRLREHKLFHHNTTTLLLSAPAIAPNKVEAVIRIVLNSSKPKVTSFSPH